VNARKRSQSRFTLAALSRQRLSPTAPV